MRNADERIHAARKRRILLAPGSAAAKDGIHLNPCRCPSLQSIRITGEHNIAERDWFDGIMTRDFVASKDYIKMHSSSNIEI